jgi:two-component system KDP operon response regulator KdpE
VILLVEDSDVQRGSTAALLRSSGFAVRSAATAARALTLVGSLKPKAIVLDLSLPDGTGADLLRAFAAWSGLAEVPVVVTTGLHPRDLPPLDPPPARVLHKPFEIGELEAVLHEVAPAACPAVVDTVKPPDAKGTP